MKSIEKIYNGRATAVGSILVQELLPSNGNSINPFLVFHHGVAVADKDIPVHLQGVGPHPHRGFSAISFIYKGGIHHQDSRGNNHIVTAGGTQWTHAGRGIVHSERPPHNIHALGGEQELLQVWVNTPAAHKMDIPHYYPATEGETPTIVTDDGLTTIRIPAGELNGVKGIIPTFTPVNTFMGQMKPGGKFTFAIPENHNSFLYVLSGTITVNGAAIVSGKQLAAFSQDGDNFSLEANSDTSFFVGTGLPIDEPIVSHGPFVMNTQTEIMEAFKDYQMGKMGVLIEAEPANNE